MQLLGKVALGGSVVSAATAGWLVAAGVFATSATLVLADPVAPAAEADELAAFDSCATLLDWYVERGVKDVGPYGWDYPVHTMDALVPRLSPSTGVALEGISASKDAAGSSPTGTNTQEAEVDEPDVAKTDGELVARIVGDRMLVLVDVSGDEPRVTRRLDLPSNGYGNELLMVGDHVLVTQQTYDRGTSSNTPRSSMPWGGGRAVTRVLDVDISDPGAPKLLSTDEYTGSMLSLRQYGDMVRLVTSTPRPELRWAHPGKGVSEKAATARNRQLVRETTIEDWLPSVARGADQRSLLGCTDVFHPKAWSGANTVAVTTFGIANTTGTSAVGITADGQTVYSSADRLYVASTDWGGGWSGGWGGGCRGDVCINGDLVSRPSEKVVTNLHAFRFTEDATVYAGSGHVAGSLRDRWSLDSEDGRLRVAWSTVSRSGSSNGITVFAERDGRLEPTGSVTGLGPDEDIQAVRWFDDLAIVVTFRQVDPLYTIDLSDPDRPRKLGALKIPGYSGYLHPIGGDLILGLGMDADRTGRTRGAQAAVFDISDLTDPRRISQARFGRDTGLPALDDPRAFSWLPSSRTAVTPVADWLAGQDNRLVGLEISEDGQLRERTLATLGQDWQARTLPLPGGRIAVLDAHRVRVLEVG